MSNTRLLVLGCVRFSQPVHGYEVRRELVSWSVESWAKVNAGSIYHALGQLTREGHLEVVGTEQQSGRPARTMYRLTGFGEDEFFRLLRAQAWATEAPVDSFSTVLSFIWTLPRDEAIRVLRHQISWARTYSGQLWSSAEEFRVSEIPSDGRPSVVPEHHRLTAGLVQAHADWAEHLLARFEKGEILGFPTTGQAD